MNRIMSGRPVTCLIFIAAALPLLIFLNCAKNLPPPGGPEDKTPPEVIESFPSMNSKNVALDTQIKIVFSEPISRQAVEGEIFISPVLENDPEVVVKGKTLIIKPVDELMDDRTYVIVIGTNVTDLHGNRMLNPFSLAFSTGMEIDDGLITGRGYIGDSPAIGLNIWAFMLSDSVEIDPVNEVPDYITHTGENGEFQLRHLALGCYRLFAVMDKNKDKLWDSDSEEYGTAPYDIRLTEDENGFAGIDLTAAKIDTLPPLIASCLMRPEGILEVGFETELDFDSVLNLDLYSFESETGDECPFKPFDIYALPRQPSSVYIRGDILRDGSACSLFVEGVVSRDGVVIDTTGNSCLFIASVKADDEAPRIIMSYPADGDTRFPVDSTIVIAFSEPMLIDSVSAGLTLTDSLEDEIPGDYYWMDDVLLRFKPVHLEGGWPYRLELDVDRTVDLAMNPLEDSVWAVKFTTMPSDTGGTVMGRIDFHGMSGFGLVFLPMGRGRELTYLLPGPGVFEIDGIPGSRYRVYAFADLDDDGEYFSGGYKPFRFSEPRAFFPDTIDVRPRWETDGVDITIPCPPAAGNE
jgi:hypothetical protein